MTAQIAIAKATKPIIFSPAMAQAIYEGRKTMTRRIVEPQPAQKAHCTPTLPGDWVFRVDANCYRVTNHPHDNPDILCLAKYQPGEILYVREAYWKHPPITQRMMRDGADTWPEYAYAADGDGDIWRALGWKKMPSIHMPKDAARSFLEILAVRCERVQSISLSDCAAEAAPPTHPADRLWDSTDTFKELWDSINGPGAWERNDWVWVYSFKKIEVGT